MAGAQAAGPRAADAESTASADTSQILETFRKRFDFPALAVVVVKDGKICDRAAVGVRKLGDPTPVTTNDVFQIHSCTKSMSATLAAILIEEGKLRWDTTIAEVFPELKDLMHTQYAAVTMEQLLTHRGGFSTRPPTDAIRRAFETHRDIPQEFRPAVLERFGRFDFDREKTRRAPVEQRKEFIKAVLAEPPEAAPGTRFVYSNQGYVVAGAMLEKITGRPWEELMTEKIFWPLRMNTAGFGLPGTIGKVDQPWGHTTVGETIRPVQYDNPPVIAPAGTVHCSLDDLASFCMAHLQGERLGGLVTPQTFRKLHASVGGYACGWICVRQDWAPAGRTLYHGGGGPLWRMIMWLAPEKDFCIVVVTNFDRPGEGSAKTGDQCDEVANALIKKWLSD
jgi:CubicO group peptidase (beta-lactamase class C family)